MSKSAALSFPLVLLAADFVSTSAFCPDAMQPLWEGFLISFGFVPEPDPFLNLGRTLTRNERVDRGFFLLERYMDAASKRILDEVEARTFLDDLVR